MISTQVPGRWESRDEVQIKRFQQPDRIQRRQSTDSGTVVCPAGPREEAAPTDKKAGAWRSFREPTAAVKYVPSGGVKRRSIRVLLSDGLVFFDMAKTELTDTTVEQNSRLRSPGSDDDGQISRALACD